MAARTLLLDLDYPVKTLFSTQQSMHAILQGKNRPYFGTLHGLLVDKFGSMARDVISQINSGDGEITEQSLVGDSRHGYQVSFKSLPLFDVSTMMTDDSTSFTIMQFNLSTDD